MSDNTGDNVVSSWKNEKPITAAAAGGITPNGNDAAGEDYHSLPPPPPRHDLAPHEQHREPLMVTFAGVAGNMLEWFDFSCYGYFSDVIAENFFPPDQGGHINLVQSFAVFGLAFLARPIGGAVIGQMGDMGGRKLALETSLFLMAVPTFAMGCLPTYAAVGRLSTVLLVLCRIAQGVSVGGQVMSSVVFTMERAHRSRWGLWGSVVASAQGAGVTMGSIFSYVLREALTDEQLYAWGWRIPFFFGVLGVVPAFYLKKYGHEHHVPDMEGSRGGISDEEQQQQQQQQHPTHARGPPRRTKSVIAESLSPSNCRSLWAATLVAALPSAAYYVVFIWLAIFMESIVDPPVPHAFAINSAVSVLGVGGMIAGGWFADWYGRYVPLMAVSGVFLGALCPPLLLFIGYGDPVVAFVCQLFLGLFLVLWNGAMLPWLVASFPPSLRLTSVSIGYNIAICVFGGFAPAVATLLVDNYSYASPGILITVVAVLSLIGLCIAPRGLTEEEEGAGGGRGEIDLVESKAANAEGKSVTTREIT